jgi:hypothetical protein
MLKSHSLGFIEAELDAPGIVKLCRARRGVISDRCGLFERAPVLEVRGDPGCPQAVVAELRCDAGGAGEPADHRLGVR